MIMAENIFENKEHVWNTKFKDQQSGTMRSETFILSEVILILLPPPNRQQKIWKTVSSGCGSGGGVFCRATGRSGKSAS